MLLVLDASVVIKWLKEEKDSAKALKIRDEYCKGMHEIMVPDLVLYEIANALRFDGKFTPDLIKKSIESLFDMDITITTPSVDLIGEATKLAHDHKTTVYDAVYMALALKVNGVFITADAALYKRITKYKNCKLL
ncbi:MAG: type II toxin-antitoxin system VapC family toxin [Candidatus Altiarchaeota archaeon]|nr:type II toxin-antitoxin system VapC family toxin [Candidatus Altiarchaeota archaeon]